MSRGSEFAKVGSIALVQIIWASGAAIRAGAADTNYELKPISLPGASGAVALDYFACDRATGKVWVPASNTGSVDVIDEKTDAVSQDEKLRLGLRRRASETELFTSVTAATRPFASSTQGASRAATVCRLRNPTGP